MEARKKIYLPVYQKLAKVHPLYTKLEGLLEKRVNLLIVEVDGPRSESLNYYKETYGVSDDLSRMILFFVIEENMNIMLNDTRHAFGHGYCLGISFSEMS